MATGLADTAEAIRTAKKGASVFGIGIGDCSPNILKNTAVGFLLGLLLAAAFVVIRELTDKRVRSESDLEEQFGIPVIGTIPDYRTTGKGGRSA